MSEPPKLIAIDHDDYHAQHIGCTDDGRQFFLTAPFEPQSKETDGAEYVALYVFDSKGKLVATEIDNFGPRATLNKSAQEECYGNRLKQLGSVSYCRIEVEPFVVERFGSQFGLITREPDDSDDIWAVELQPGNYMAFFEPWDSGEYDT